MALRRECASAQNEGSMADKNRDYGPNIIEDPRRPGALYVRVYHAAHVYSDGRLR